MTVVIEEAAFNINSFHNVWISISKSFKENAMQNTKKCHLSHKQAFRRLFENTIFFEI